LARVLLVELQDELADLARRNVERNALAAHVTVRCEDLRTGGWRAQVASPALLVCNPPFFRVGEGRLSPKPFAARARHELTLSLGELIGAIGPALDERSRLAMVYPASREDELLATLSRERLTLRRRRAICAFPGAPPRRLLLLVARGEAGGEPEQLEPLYERRLDGRVSEERG
jgi:tRNA1Val (adenine37-N6)-methyltransferase